MDKITILDEEIELMKKYLQVQFNKQDWHGVQDAASDIRELIREKKVREELIVVKNMNETNNNQR